MRSRRAVLLASVVYTVLFLVVLLFVILLLLKIRVNWSDGFGDRETCKLSVQARMSTDYRIKDVSVSPEIVDFDCPRRLVIVNDGHVEVNDKKTSFYDGRTKKNVKEYETLTPDLIDSLVADEMAGCWYQFMEGRADLFGNDMRMFDYFNKKRACAICSEISFETSAKLPNSLKATAGLFEDLNNIAVRKKYSSDQVSAHDYIFNQETICNEKFNTYFKSPSPICIQNYLMTYASDRTQPLNNIDFLREWGLDLKSRAVLQIAPDISTDKRYVVLFGREGGHAFSGKSTKSTYFVWLVDADKMSSNYCDEYFG